MGKQNGESGGASYPPYKELIAQDVAFLGVRQLAWRAFWLRHYIYELAPKDQDPEARAALEATRKEYRRRLRPRIDDEDELEDRERRAADAENDAAAARILTEHRPHLTLVPFGLPEPPAVIKPAHRQGVFLGEGMVGIMSGPGETGKSTSLLALLHAAGPAHSKGIDPFGTAIGLSVRQGPVALLNYEDPPQIIARRMEWYGPPSDWSHVNLMSANCGPLWGPEDNFARVYSETEDWSILWSEVKKVGAKLVVIDPASVAFAGNANEAAGVRAFLAALTGQAVKNACAVLLIAHDTKSSRREADVAGTVSGSAQWVDGARAVLHLRPLPPAHEHSNPELGEDRLLVIAKANYARSGIGHVLVPRTGSDGRWAGLEAASPAREYSRHEIAALVKGAGKPKQKKAKAEEPEEAETDDVDF